MDEVTLKPIKVELTPEEKIEKRRAYHREYMRKRYATDKAFADKQRELKRVSEKNKYTNDPEYRQSKIDNYKERYSKYRDAYKQINTTKPQ